MFARFLVLLLLIAIPLPAAAQRLELEPESLKPGLIAEYRSSVEASAALWRNEAKPAFYLGHSSPHPRLPAGAFEVTWTGVIHLREDGPLSFSAYAGGHLHVEVDGVTVLEGRGASDQSLIPSKQSLKREPGYYRITIHFHSTA